MTLSDLDKTNHLLNGTGHAHTTTTLVTTDSSTSASDLGTTTSNVVLAAPGPTSDGTELPTCS